MPFALLSYDIVDNKRRTKLAKYLQDYGQRVQYSVFELYEEEAELRTLFTRMLELINPTEDSLRMYILCHSCHKKIISAGKENEHDFESDYIII